LNESIRASTTPHSFSVPTLISPEPEKDTNAVCRVERESARVERKFIYVAHPLRPDPANERQCRASRETTQINIEATSEICKSLLQDYPDYLILSPIHAFGFIDPLDKSNEAKALESCRRLLELADELWVFGNYGTSEGCQMEIAHAEALGKKIIYKLGSV
jgi:hypothetical protein